MPRVSAPRRTAVETPPALVASAQVMTPSAAARPRQTEGWQSQAWAFYDKIGELRYAANWVGNVLSRARLFAAKRTPLGLPLPSKSGPAVDVLAELFGGADGQAQMLKAIGIHFFIAGECYLVGRTPAEDRDTPTGPSDMLWEIVSTEEMKTAGNRWQIDYKDGLGPINLTDEDIVIRLWMPHPRRHLVADSPVRAQLANLAELETLSRMVTGQALSRLAGNGLVAIPSEISFPPPPGEENLNSAQSFQQVLGGAMMDSIGDPASPSARVPIVITAPGEYIGNIRHVTFFTEFDAQLPELRNEAIRRLALGLDIPPEVMLGTADLNHWGAWQIEESSIKVSIEPMLESITNAISTGYVRPATGDYTDIVGYDTSQLRLRPNRSKEAIELFDRMELSGEALRRETGFDEGDVPADDERKIMLIQKIASGSASPEMVAQAIALLGIKGIEPAGDQMNEARPAPSLQDHPTRDIPDEQPDRQAASLFDKSEMLVMRALERAGNRLRSLKQTRPPCDAVDAYRYIKTDVGELDKVMADAWAAYADRALRDVVPEVIRSAVIHALDAYCRNLLLSQDEFCRAEMERYLMSVPLRSLA